MPGSAQTVSEVVLSLSCAETVQEGLEKLITEVQRLMRAVAELKRKRVDPTLPTKDRAAKLIGPHRLAQKNSVFSGT